jgi:hypothetical protein
MSILIRGLEEFVEVLDPAWIFLADSIDLFELGHTKYEV